MKVNARVVVTKLTRASDTNIYPKVLLLAGNLLPIEASPLDYRFHRPCEHSSSALDMGNCV
jgi:hypothetical protein